MKKHVIIGICVLLALALAGCGQNAATIVTADAADTGGKWGEAATPENTPAAADTTPDSVTSAASEDTEAVMPTDAAYRIDGTLLLMEAGADQAAVYDAAEQYPAGWNCGLESFIVGEDALYLTEYGVPTDGENGDEYIYRIVRVDFDGGHRMELVSQEYIGFLQEFLYGDKLVYVSDGFDSVMIGWVYRNGTGGDWLNFSQYAEQKGVEPEYNNAELYFVGDDLFADIVFFDFDNEESELVDDTVWIKPDMTVESAVD